MEKLMEYGISLASRSYIFFWKFNCAKSLTKSRTQERLYIGMKFIFFSFFFLGKYYFVPVPIIIISYNFVLYICLCVLLFRKFNFLGFENSSSIRGTSTS